MEGWPHSTCQMHLVGHGGTIPVFLAVECQRLNLSLFPLTCGQKTGLEQNPDKNISNALLFVCFRKNVCVSHLALICSVQPSSQSMFVMFSLLYMFYSKTQIQYHVQSLKYVCSDYFSMSV